MSLVDILASVAREVGKSTARKTATRRKPPRKATPKRKTAPKQAPRKTTARKTTAKDDLGKLVKDILTSGQKSQVAGWLSG